MSKIVRNGRLALALAAALLFAGCGDVIDNSLGINGSPSWNVPMDLDGTWSGRAWPTVRDLIPCLQAESYTADQTPRLTIEVRRKTLVGQLKFADGASFELSGKTLSGSSFAGDNLARADIKAKGRKIGTADFEPDGMSGRLAANVYLTRPGSDARCSLPVTLERVGRAPAPD